MAKVTAGMTLVAALLFYFLFFTFLWIENNAEASTQGLVMPGAEWNNPGFDAQMNPFLTTEIERCIGPVDISTVTWRWDKKAYKDSYFLDCAGFNDAITCNKFKNCNWTNDTIFWRWRVEKCGSVYVDDENDNKGLVNLSYYGFPVSPDENLSNNASIFYTGDNDLCANISGLNNPVTCQQFACTWYNVSGGNLALSGGSSVNYVSMLHIIKWIGTFEYSFGFGTPFDQIADFIVLYLVGIIIAISLYYMFIPG